jgi:glycosyltransferase involved in cell wall biosynthesis
MEAVLTGRRQVVTVHDTIPLDFPRAHPRQHRYWRHVLGRALTRAAVVLAPSEATRDRLRSRYALPAARVRVIPHGVPVPMAVARRGAADRERFVLWLGRIGPMKNLDALVAAFRPVREATGHDLLIAGPGARPAALSRGAAPGVSWVGPIEEAEKIRLLDRAALLVCPSRDEGFGLPPLEAMARGCPVVVSRRGSLPEVCGDAAVYFDPDDVTAIAAALLRTIADRDLRNRLAVRGLLRAATHTWERSARAHLAAFEEVLGWPLTRLAGGGAEAGRVGPGTDTEIGAARPAARSTWS